MVTRFLVNVRVPCWHSGLHRVGSSIGCDQFGDYRHVIHHFRNTVIIIWVARTRRKWFADDSRYSVCHSINHLTRIDILQYVRICEVSSYCKSRFYRTCGRLAVQYSLMQNVLLESTRNKLRRPNENVFQNPIAYSQHTFGTIIQ